MNMKRIGKGNHRFKVRGRFDVNTVLMKCSRKAAIEGADVLEKEVHHVSYR